MRQQQAWRFTVLAALLASPACSIRQTSDDAPPALASTVPSTINADFPAIDVGTAAETKTKYQAAGLDTWVHGIDSQSEQIGECVVKHDPLSKEQFEVSVQLSDALLGQLLLNADAALRASQVFCDTGDPAGAMVELADLERTLVLIRIREEMLGL